jgi:HK97 family phage portal protein
MSKVQSIKDFPGLFELIASKGKSVVVNTETAQKHTAVYGCNKAISDDLAGLPIHVYQKKDGKVRKATEHPVYELIKLAPNPDMRAFNYDKSKLLHALNTGNAYSLVERSRITPVKNIWPLDPEEVTIERVLPGGNVEEIDGFEPSTGGRGKLRYKLDDGMGQPLYYSPENILHVKGYTWDGIVGQTPITTFAKTQVGIGLEMDTFQQAFFENSMNPGGVFEHPTSLGEKNKPKFLEALKKRFMGGKKRGTPMVLEKGMKFVPYEIKMADQQFIDLLKLNKTDICGIIGVPESRLSISGSNTNYNNTEAERRRYFESGLLPWAVVDEQEMNLRLLTKEDRAQGYYIKYNFSGFLRGNAKERADVSKIWSGMGVPVNRLLELEDQNPVDGGDIGLVQVQMVPLKDIEKINEPDPVIPAVEKKNIDKNGVVVHTNKNTEGRQIENRALNHIVAGRNKIKKRYFSLIETSINKIVSRENIALTKELKKQISARADTDFSAWVDNFYKTFPAFIDKNLRNVLTAYNETMQEVVAGEIGAEEFDDITAETKSYISGYANKYVDASRGQIFQQLDLGSFEAVQTRAEEWRDKRSDKELFDVVDGSASMVAASVIIGGGFSLTWRNVGKVTCPLCKQLNGRKVTKTTEAFTDKGEDFTDAEDKTVNFRRTLYPPLHQKCDCIVSA